MSKKTVYGSVMNKLRAARQKAREDATLKLWKRNGLDGSISNRAYYKIAEDTTVAKDGQEVTTLKLWKLVDKEVVTVGLDINIKNREGIEDGDKYSNRATPTNNTGSPI